MLRVQQLAGTDRKDKLIMRISNTIHDSIVDGPGLRYVVFTQGCRHNCKGCHNPGTHDPMGGKELSLQEVISDMRSNPLTDGLTLSGGEPFLQVEACAALARAAHENGLNVWCYSGYTFEQLLRQKEMRPLLDQVDVLVEGPFMLEQKSLTLKWRGSSNQRMLDLKSSLSLGRAVTLESK